MKQNCQHHLWNLIPWSVIYDTNVRETAISQVPFMWKLDFLVTSIWELSFSFLLLILKKLQFEQMPQQHTYAIRNFKMEQG